jgi:hypothetical protein
MHRHRERIATEMLKQTAMFAFGTSLTSHLVGFLSAFRTKAENRRHLSRRGDQSAVRPMG